MGFGDLAAKLDTAERTVCVYLVERSTSGRFPVAADKRRRRLVEGATLQLGPLSFQLEEAAVVHLAARWLIRHSDEPTPAVRDAIALAIQGYHLDTICERHEA